MNPIFVQATMTTLDGETFLVKVVHLQTDPKVDEALSDKINSALQNLTIKITHEARHLQTKPMTGAEHSDIVKIYFAKKIGMCKLARGGSFRVKGEILNLSKRSSRTVFKQIKLHNHAIEKYGFCIICRAERSPLECRTIRILKQRGVPSEVKEIEN